MFGLGPFEMLLSALLFVVWIWGLLRCLTRESHQGNTKVSWLLVIILVPVLGSVLYLLLRRPPPARAQEA